LTEGDTTPEVTGVSDGVSTSWSDLFSDSDDFSDGAAVFLFNTFFVTISGIYSFDILVLINLI
jgi:hypothetical protein